MAKMTSDEICKLLDVLVGKTEPAADQSIDDERLENLNILIDISYWAIRRLYCTSEHRTSSYCSSKEIGERAYLAMMDLKEYFEDEEQSDDRYKEMVEAIKKQGVIYSNIPADVIPVSVLQEVKWIPVKERLPDDYVTVLATLERSYEYGGTTQEITMALYDFDDEKWILADDNTLDRYENIIAWAPLPEPYREDE